LTSPLQKIRRFLGNPRVTSFHILRKSHKDPKKTEKGWKGSRRGAIIAIKGALNWAYENKKIASNPLRGSSCRR
jgi:hypothetical protein